MSSELPREPNDDQLEAGLSAYAPRPPRIDRDRLMFEAGRAAAQSHPSAVVATVLRPGVIAWFPVPPTLVPTNWLWPAVTLTMTLLAASLGIALLLRSDPRERVPVVSHVAGDPSPAAVHPPLVVSSGGLQRIGRQPAVAEATPVLTVESLPANHLLRVRQVALTEGVEALAPPASRETPRLAPPPTRGTLMRTMLITRGAGSPAQSALGQWSNWFTSDGPR
jgi:hypothetical protein